MKFSVNNRFITELYIKEGLKAKVQGGIATPGQRDGLKGLKTVMDTKLADGTVVPEGSLIYIREETLFAHAFASKPLTCESLGEGRFLIVDLQFVEFIDTPDKDRHGQVVHPTL